MTHIIFTDKHSADLFTHMYLTLWAHVNYDMIVRLAIKCGAKVHHV